LGYATERALAEQALNQERVDRSSAFPPAADHLREAREAKGLSPQQLATRFGSEGHLCPDLELYDDELFTCISISDLLRLAEVLGTSAPALLFGEDVPAPIQALSFSNIADRIRSHLSAVKATPDAWGELVGWDVQPILADPRALGTYNVQGLRDICSGLGLDWVGVLSEHGRTDRPTKR
jgi:hypothetical protein